ncbi:MAG: biotin--[acetyl-CoA-carboxylase] ligase [Muribaculaceae bacterium]|nr:biotin--[acetyl-CoA-carboxylase] ligase [Muribaculaceae bacterium]
MIYRFNSLDSTSSQMARMEGDLRHGDVVITYSQTAGRGQRGNSWESAPGMNLTFSMLLMPPDLLARDAWRMSMAVSVGIVHALSEFTGCPVSLKWPNDVYVGDMKLCGILIENSLRGEYVSRSVVGIGINVNQTEFLSDAPNPVSLRSATGREFDLDEVLDAVCREILSSVAMMHRPELDSEYRSLLWRGTGVHPWRDTATGEIFNAAVTDILPDGRIVLGDRTYWFKEVAALL